MKNSIKRDEYKRFLTYIQDKIGIKVLATRTCHSIEDCDRAFFKILKVYENAELERLRGDNEDLRNDNIALELKVDELIKELIEENKENAMLLEKIEERQENIFIRVFKYIFG